MMLGVRGFIEIRHQFLVLIRRLVDAEQLSVAGLIKVERSRRPTLKAGGLKNDPAGACLFMHARDTT